MSREIKFRAWNKEEGKWIYAEPIYGFFPSLKMDEEQGKHLEERYGDIQQYTGLNDKNGREIYEGDILATNGLVEFASSGFWCREKNPLGADNLNMPNEAYREVIGNIYENPDLLK